MSLPVPIRLSRKDTLDFYKAWNCKFHASPEMQFKNSEFLPQRLLLTCLSPEQAQRLATMVTPLMIKLNYFLVPITQHFFMPLHTTIR